MPRWALLLFCAAYVIPGFVGRAPWKSADLTAFGYMLELAHGRTDWLDPRIAGFAPETDGLLPYWLGAWSVRLFGNVFGVEMAARLPFAALLALTLVATWYGVYHLARSPAAQPVAFAFGGEARPVDYARAIADGGLLALVACLGLAQFSHEGTAYLTQLSCTALVFYALAAAPHRTLAPAVSLVLGLPGLALSGGPVLAVVFGAIGTVLAAVQPEEPDVAPARIRRVAIAVGLATLAVVALAQALALWRWRILLPGAGDGGKQWQSLGRLLLWFTWPTWPLVLWTVWRWRRQIASRRVRRHLLLPLGFALTALTATLFTQPADRALLLGLPSFAALAAFALPTLRRSVAAIIDWFTLLFFTTSAITIWVVWISLQTGVPAKPAANVAKLAPGFVPSFSLVAFLAALAATLAWLWLVAWRTGRNRSAIWRSLVLPAGGAALCWLLLSTLWLPALDFARSYAAQSRSVARIVGQPTCMEFFGLSRAQIVGLRHHGHFTLVPAGHEPRCEWLAVDFDARAALPSAVDAARWQWRATVNRPTDKTENLMLFQRKRATDGG
ncbi:hypothetical protein [Xylophilus sp.]|uniref:hypothetical protein n=1 Tax=Xylophilus sp. TaxID=2653893 RepID=UPI0013BC7923|nr:MAG: hypothetical protein GAK38_02045 [Xylophilus sp.]